MILSPPQETSAGGHRGTRRRDGRRLALVCQTPGHDLPDAREELPSYGPRRIHASILTDPRLSDSVVKMFDICAGDIEATTARILEFDPDVVGFSAYVWSLPSFVAMARTLRRALPDVTIVFGGPSARPEMFAFEPYASAVPVLDVLVTSFGEETMRDILLLEDRSADALARVAGVAIPRGSGWEVTAERPSAPLDDLASPAELGLLPRGSWHYLETYRGCPMSCTFCQWGSVQAPRDVLSTARIAAELEAGSANGALGVAHLDAGLTLNERAFRNLAAAEREVGFLARSSFSCEVYPAHLTDAHIAFLQSVGCSYIGVGLQSYNGAVLKTVERRTRPETFDTIVRRLVAAVGNVAVEIILGLPGDSLASFKHTVERALELGADVHVYHCLVLPEAFLTKAPPEFALRFDPITLKVESCAGWTPDEIHEAREWMTKLSRDMQGNVGAQEWLTGRFLRADVRPRGVQKDGEAAWPAPMNTPVRTLPVVP